MYDEKNNYTHISNYNNFKNCKKYFMINVNLITRPKITIHTI